MLHRERFRVRRETNPVSGTTSSQRTKTAMFRGTRRDGKSVTNSSGTISPKQREPRCVYLIVLGGSKQSDKQGCIWHSHVRVHILFLDHFRSDAGPERSRYGNSHPPFVRFCLRLLFWHGTEKGGPSTVCCFG